MRPVHTMDDLYVLAAELGISEIVTEGTDNLIGRGQGRRLEDDQAAEKLLLIQLS